MASGFISRPAAGWSTKLAWTPCISSNTDAKVLRSNGWPLTETKTLSGSPYRMTDMGSASVSNLEQLLAEIGAFEQAHQGLRRVL